MQLSASGRGTKLEEQLADLAIASAIFLMSFGKNGTREFGCAFEPARQPRVNCRDNALAFGGSNKRCKRIWIGKGRVEECILRRRKPFAQ